MDKIVRDTAQDLTYLTKAELFKLEKEIANRHLGHFPWMIVSWSILNFVVWLSLWPLVFLNIIPLWFGFIISICNIALSYLPSHDAQHSIIAKPGQKFRWLNELVGWIGSIPLTTPYPVFKATHMEHHKHANDPNLDPDYYVTANGPWHAVWRIIISRQPRSNGTDARYLASLERNGRQDLVILSAMFKLTFYGFLILMAWNGLALEAALLWWLPVQIAGIYISFFLSWAPHHPGQEIGCYRDTRAWKFQLGNIASMGMQYHIVHHLHPRIPLYRTPQAYREMRPILEARGCDLQKL